MEVRLRILVLLLCVTQPILVQSQTVARVPPPFELDGTQQRPVLLTTRQVIRASDDPLPENLTPIQRAMHMRDRIYNGMVSVELSVVIDLNGRVESAKPIRGPQRFYEQATEIETHRAFEPVRDKDGMTVRAHFTDYVSVEPPERWSDHPTFFPEPVDLSKFRITLERTSCFGSCPFYKVAITGSGDVLWEGGAGPYNVAIPGAHHAKVSHEAVLALVDQVRSSHVLNALDKYEAGWTDNPTYTVTVDINGLHKEVVDYIGTIVGMPTSVRELEEAIDRTARTEKWIKGNAETMPSLAAENWNFAADSKDNLQLYDNALNRGNREMVAAFKKAKGPIFSADPAIESPVCVASGSRDIHLVLDMLATLPKDRKISQYPLDECLVGAARGGDVELVNLWLKRGASLTPAAPPKSDEDAYVRQLDYPLTAAIRGGSPVVVRRLLDLHAPVDPEHDGNLNLVTYAAQASLAHGVEDKEAMVKMLLDAGADPNQETPNDKPALFRLSEAKLVPVLIAGGAKVNGQDSDGNTPLMSTIYVDTLKALLEAGADPTLRNKQGKTAGEQFRAWGMKEQADLLDAAVKARLGIAEKEPSVATQR